MRDRDCRVEHGIVTAEATAATAGLNTRQKYCSAVSVHPVTTGKALTVDRTRLCDVRVPRDTGEMEGKPVSPVRRLSATAPPPNPSCREAGALPAI